VGCSGDDAVIKESRLGNAFKLYEKAQESMQSQNYLTAVTYLEQLNNLYPFGAYSHEAQLNLIYAYYKLGKYPSASASADRFIRQNPRHKNLDYAYYMKGLVNFAAETSMSKTLFSAPISERDMTNARQSFNDFAELIRLFPESKYARDAQKRMIYLRDHMAKYELYVANYYMQREAYQAVLSRAQYIVDHYPKTSSVPYALKLLMVTYDLLGLAEESERSRRVLLLNYPDFKG
jgi:outer membrane protein assembly factor BamD